MRQGCPHSPLLYALSIEPLAQCIPTDPHLIGRRGVFEERIGLYADDMILYLADPDDSLNRELQLIDQFGKFSGLQINWSKSHILPLDSFPRTLQQALLPLQWCSSIKYLGINVTRNIPDFLNESITPLVEFVRAKTRSWSQLPLSVAGRVNLIKMILLPKILYVTQQSPLYLSQSIFDKLNSILKSFVQTILVGFEKCLGLWRDGSP